MQYDINFDWKHFCVRRDMIVKLYNQFSSESCECIINKDFTQLSESKQVLLQQYKDEIAKDQKLVDIFFQIELKKISKLSNQVQQIIQEQFQNVKVGKRSFIIVLIKQCWNQSVTLRNYLSYNIQELNYLNQLINSKHTYTFANSDQLNSIQIFLLHSYKSLLNISHQTALQALTPITDRPFSPYFLILLSIIFINLQQNFFINNKLRPIQQMLVRTNFMVSVQFLVFGLMLKFHFKRKINSRAVLGIPNGICNGRFLQLGVVHMSVVFITTMCFYLGVMEENGDKKQIILSKIVYGIVGMWQPSYWLLVPKVLLVLYISVDIIRAKGEDCISSYIFGQLYQTFIPKRGNVEFRHFIYGSTLCSVRDTFRDLLGIISCNQLKDYVTVSIANVVNIIRIYQSYLRAKHHNGAYPHYTYMVQFTLNIFNTFNQISAIKAKQNTYWSFVATRCADTLFKFVFDIHEDWGMIIGGSLAKKFRSQPNKWAHGRYVKRPTQILLWQLIGFHVFDYCAASLWILTLFKSLNQYTSQFWFQSFLPILEVIRRTVWSLVKLDNFCASTVESYCISVEKELQNAQIVSNANNIIQLQDIQQTATRKQKSGNLSKTVVSQLKHLIIAKTTSNNVTHSINRECNLSTLAESSSITYDCTQLNFSQNHEAVSINKTLSVAADVI
ncbi:EXS_family protein [Hexamita inflata]|uniref:EXS family protein n=1 Tax=Hexamita inflata TaxID=28002 RepID=A0AA86QM69_9EUKA|nr:EXS family protein [Hexamita inflata]